jgi:predicted AAA+ superfamily ATPase
MKRAMIITGPPYSGKTFLSKQIAELFNPLEVVYTTSFKMMQISEALMQADNITKLLVIDECESSAVIHELNNSAHMKLFREKGGAVIYVSQYGRDLTDRTQYFIVRPFDRSPTYM